MHWKAKVLDGGTLSEPEAYSLCETELSQRADLWGSGGGDHASLL